MESLRMSQCSFSNLWRHGFLGALTNGSDSPRPQLQPGLGMSQQFVVYHLQMYQSIPAGYVHINTKIKHKYRHIFTQTKNMLYIRLTQIYYCQLLPPLSYYVYILPVSLLHTHARVPHGVACPARAELHTMSRSWSLWFASYTWLHLPCWFRIPGWVVPYSSASFGRPYPSKIVIFGENTIRV